MTMDDEQLTIWKTDASEVSEFIIPAFGNVGMNGRVILKCVCAGRVGEQVANFGPDEGVFILSLTRA
jgi:hypothetical protein